MENLKRIKLVCDSSIDLKPEFIQEEEIEILRFPVSIDGNEYLDGENITVDELYAKIKKTNQLPKTSAFSPKYYEDVWKKFANDYESVIYIGLGSGFSSSLNSAILSTEKFDNVYIIDSQNLSSGTGLLVFKICKMRKEGLDGKTIVEKIEELVPRVHTQFAINTLQYLHMGGRCTGTAKIFGTLLKIKPIIKVVNNSMVVAKKPIGFGKALDAMLDDVISHKDSIDLDHIMVTHSKADEDAPYLIDELAKHFDRSIIMETYASGTISTHCGPRTIGILYISKE